MDADKFPGPLPPWADLLEDVRARLSAVDPAAAARLAQDLGADDRRWYLGGAGRSGLVARMIAMRLMQLGRTAYVVGDTATPAIASRDGLLLVSGSGETMTTVMVAEAGAQLGAHIWAVTAEPSSRLATVADEVITLRSDRPGEALSENARDLSLLLLLDGVLAAVGRRDPSARERMPLMHANLE